MNKREQYRRIIKFVTSISIVALQMLLYWIVWMHFYASNIELPFFRKGNWLMAALYGVLLLFFCAHLRGTENRLPAEVGHDLFPHAGRYLRERGDLCPDLPSGQAFCKCGPAGRG